MSKNITPTYQRTRELKLHIEGCCESMNRAIEAARNAGMRVDVGGRKIDGKWLARVDVSCAATEVSKEADKCLR